MARRRSNRHSTHHRATHRARTTSSRKGKPHPHRGAHVPHPGARHHRTESAAQKTAAQANLAKARAAQKGKPRSAAQLAAARGNLAKARAARKAHPGMRRAEDGTWVPADYYTKKVRAPRGYVRMADGSLLALGPYRRTKDGRVVLRSTRGTRGRTVRHVAGPRVHRATARRAPNAAGHTRRAHAASSSTRHVHHRFGVARHYNRRGLTPTTHWRSGHRAATRTHRARWAWSTSSNRRRGWSWTRTTRRQQW